MLDTHLCSRGLLACAIALAAGCNAYDSGLLRLPNPGPHGKDSGVPDDGLDGGGEDGGGQPCRPQTEICNGADDDCDGKVDESTQAYCESVILHAQSECAVAAGRCVKLKCDDGYADCDGKPQNGCEQPFCSCNDCSDAGAEADGGS